MEHSSWLWRILLLFLHSKIESTKTEANKRWTHFWHVLTPELTVPPIQTYTNTVFSNQDLSLLQALSTLHLPTSGPV